MLISNLISSPKEFFEQLIKIVGSIIYHLVTPRFNEGTLCFSLLTSIIFTRHHIEIRVF
jgi:hypothetical protein